jgi:hypothetical protein
MQHSLRLLWSVSRGLRCVGGHRRHDRVAYTRDKHASRSDQKLAAEWGGRVQANAICSVAVDLRVSELVDVPNFVVLAFLPLDIFR